MGIGQRSEGCGGQQVVDIVPRIPTTNMYGGAYIDDLEHFIQNRPSQNMCIVAIVISLRQ